ncbi:MAG: PKD domain-containing protein [Thermoleophilaceae bacterium]
MTSTRLLRAIPLALVATVLALSLGAVHAPVAKAASCSDPTITGTARTGQTVTGHSTCATTLGSFSLSWYVCDDPGGTSCGSAVATTGSDTSLDYTPDDADIGKYLKFQAHASDALGANPVTKDVETGRVKGHPPPTPAFTAGPSPVLVNHTVTLDASASPPDPDGQALRFRWDFDNDGHVDRITSSPITTTKYASHGVKTIALRVEDTDGDRSSVAFQTVTVHAPPTASFVFTPDSPQSGQDVTFTSTSRDPDGDPLAYAWDLDGDGVFDDGHTSVVHFTYAKAGSYTASLKVTSIDGTSTVFRTVDVVAPPAPPPAGGKKKSKLKLLRPFPTVAIGGFFTARGVRLTLLGVHAPKGSKVMIRCKGHGCPRRTSRKHVGRKRAVVFRSFRRRFRAGAVIAVYVWKKNRIGKYTRIRIRADKRPARKDRCLDPVKLKPRRCP